MARLKWNTPKAIRQQNWHSTDKRDLLRIVGFSIKWTLLLGVPIVYAVWRTVPSEVHRVAIGVLLAPLMVGLQVLLPYITHVLVGEEYRVDSKGLHRTAGNTRRSILWRHIRAWEIDDAPRVPGIRALTVKATVLGRLRTRTFPFNPRAVDEAHLRRLLRERVRTDC